MINTEKDIKNQHIIVYSHGFGTRKYDGHRILADIAEALPEYNHILFDYCKIDENTNTLLVRPIDEQAIILNKTINKIRRTMPNAIIDIIGHSQGCIVAASLRPSNIHKTIFIGAPAELTIGDMQRVFTRIPGSLINLEDTSKLARNDGSTTIVPKDYWQSILDINPIGIYNKLANNSSVTMINAKQDEIIGNKDFSKLSPHIKSININANHDFTGAARTELINIIRQELV